VKIFQDKNDIINQTISIIVSDTGIGMNEEVQKRLFRFYGFNDVNNNSEHGEIF
jgi:hypothetical protein